MVTSRQGGTRQEDHRLPRHRPELAKRHRPLKAVRPLSSPSWRTAPSFVKQQSRKFPKSQRLTKEVKLGSRPPHVLIKLLGPITGTVIVGEPPSHPVRKSSALFLRQEYDGILNEDPLDDDDDGPFFLCEAY